MPFSDYDGLFIAIRTWRNTFLRAEDGGQVNQQTFIGPAWERWGVLKQSDGKFAFKSCHNRYMRALDVGGGINQQSFIGDCEKWQVEETVPGSGLYSFRSGLATYLRAGADDHMNQQTFVGPYEKFTIEVVSDCIEVYDMVYMIDQAKIFDTQPKSLAAQTMSNNSNNPQTMSIKISEQYQTKSSWSQSNGVKVSAKAELRAGVPIIGEAKVEVSTEYTHEWTSGTEETKTQTFTANLPMLVPAKSKCASRVTFHESKMDIPWTAKTAWKGVDGRSVTTIGGTWSGTTVYDIQYTIDAPVTL